MSALRPWLFGLTIVAVCAVAFWLWGRLPSREVPGADVVNSVTSFARHHPEWALLRDARPDEAAIRLNHARHLDPETPGMQDLLRELQRDADAHVRTMPGSEALSLSCASCHQPDDTGRRMLPIRFDNHCAKCHQDQLVRVPKIAPDGSADGLRVPHGEPDRVVEQIERALATAAAFAESRFAPPAADGAPAPTRSRRGGGTPSNSIAVPPFSTRDEVLAWLGAERDRFLKQAQTGCAYCHTGVSDSDSAPAVFHVEPPRIPDVWLPRAQFSHQSHEMLSCVQCHTAATTSVATSDVMLPGIASCRACHAPRAGAPSHCTTCHIFHQPTPYIESGTLSIDEFTGVAPASSVPAPTPAPAAAPAP